MKYTSLIIILLFLCMQSCYWGKYIDENQKVSIDSDFNIEIINNDNPKFINNHSKEEYKQALIDALNEELNEKNVTVLPANSTSADYSLKINRIIMEESSRIEVIDDTVSLDNGETYLLSICDIEAEFSLYKGKLSDNHLLKNYRILVNKEEKVTNNRSFFDYLFGLNKDNSVYRYKELPEDIFIDLSAKCGSRIHDKVTRKIAKKEKK